MRPTTKTQRLKVVVGLTSFDPPYRSDYNPVYCPFVAPRLGAFVDLEAKVCYCFHVSRRKLVNFVRQTKPKVPSQLSLCGGAGTGCGWCIPFLKQIFEQARHGGVTELEQLTPRGVRVAPRRVHPRWQGHAAAGSDAAAC